MKVKTETASGLDLDYLVAMSENIRMELIQMHDGKVWLADNCWKFNLKNAREWSPTTDWSIAGPIIEKHRLGAWYCEEMQDADGVVVREAGWYCEDNHRDNGCTGETMLIAAMRCYVRSTLGEEVEIGLVNS